MTHVVPTGAGARHGVLPGGGRAAVLLMLAYLLSFVDRQILVLMIGPLQRDLGIDDVEFGLLHGTSFALFYTIVGLFVGGLIDRYHRVRIIAWAIVVWSAATALCGIARGYAQLFAARVMVGVGEAALSPGAYSLLSDLYEPRRRTVAFAIYATGIYLGSGLAFIVGGRLIGYLETVPPVALPLLGEMQSWRLTFLIVALPGIALALAIRWLVPEPPRGLMDKAEPAGAQDAPAAGGLREFAGFVRQRWQPFAAHNLGFGLHMMLSYAMATWLPAVLMRAHGWGVADVGLVIGTQYLVVGTLGAFAGGAAARWLRARGDASSELTLGALSCAVLLIGVVALVAVPTPGVALLVSAVQIFFVAFPGSLNAASLQIVAPPRFRGQAGALFLLVGNLLGLALGPLIVGLITEYVLGDRAMVGTSLLIVGAATMPIAIALLVWGRRFFRIEPRPPRILAEQPA
ncbi:spinster family MFS transporter [Sphingopyxis granuli]|uniref:spinster family MFS transporter n=1 Tax=Sphingopyxis granuli TaxID=267128 RepID=UPI001A5AE4FC|nr:MFS transporter [Sphingopyxis granuli]MBL8649946.1 MFS transporter [Sphingopyxis sp.]QUM74603.1 MFS transporter [Sphingopyxis granuli]